VKNKLFTPGEVITTQEEYDAGRNTFEENGNIRASIVGEAVFNDTNKKVSVNGKSKELLRIGDIVYGVVSNTKESMISMDLIKTEGEKTLIVTRAQLPVRNISNNFVTDARTYFKIGDVVKARVVKSDELAVDVEVKGIGLGVVTAFCSNCRSKMDFSNEKMMCFNCGHVEERKWVDQETEVGEERGSRGTFRGNSGRSYGQRGNSRGNFRNDRGRGDSRDGNFRNNRSSSTRRNNFRGARR